ncbi:sensor histidine kinase [bacterium]|nr:sensor histidine kinase [bacterium]
MTKINKVRTCNQIALIIGLACLPYTYIFRAVNLPGLANLIIPISLLFFSVRWINGRGFRRTANFVLIVTANLAATLYSASLGERTFIHALFFAFVGLPLVIFEPDEKWSIRFSSGLALACSLFLQIHFHVKPLVPVNSIPENSIVIISECAIVTVLAITILYLRANQTEILAAHRKLTDQNQELTVRNQELADAVLDARTQRRHAESLLEQLKESRDTQEEMAHHMGYAELIRGIAHEIKNPLGMIRMRADLVNAALHDKDQVQKFAEVVARNVDRLDHLLKPMLEYSTYKTDRHIVPFSLNELLNDLDALARPRVTSQDVALIIRITEEITVLGDKHYIFQALLNLLSNAIQHTPAGGKILIEAQPITYTDPQEIHRKGVRILVSDTGAGIKPEHIPKLFTPYFTTKASRYNAGLGLSLAFRVITENNGLIRVDSEEGVGTQVVVKLPTA